MARKHRLGVSVYPDLKPLEEIKSYLELAGKHGCTRVFSSMFQLEGSREEVLSYFRDFIKIAHDNGMEVSLDVNTQFLDQIGVTPDDVHVFDEIGCDIIRMDGCYGDERDIALINNPYGIKIEFNTSAVEDYIRELVENGADLDRVITCHNFYPQPLTGMDWDKFKQSNRRIKSAADVVIAAFVSSNVRPSHGVWDAEYGLPTVERMRNWPIDVQARVLLASDDVDDILIGNAWASEEEFEALEKVVLNPEIPEIPAQYAEWVKNPKPSKIVKVELEPDITDLEKEILLDFPVHMDMGDSSEFIWRNRLPRMFYKDKSIPAKKDPDTFARGDVVIVNDNYKHYGGEIQVILIPVENDGLRHKIGTITGPELEMLDLIKDGDFVKFVEA